MFGLFDSGVFGEQTNDLYRLLISLSSIGSGVQQLREQDRELEDCRMAALIFNVSEDFEIR